MQTINKYHITKLLLIVIVVFVFIFGGLKLYNYKSFFPITTVNWQPSDIDTKKLVFLQGVIKPYIGESFWTVNLQQIQQDLIHNKWISFATINRVWPNSLNITIVWENPVARWGDLGVVTNSGKILYPEDISNYKSLVQLKASNLNASKVLRSLADFQTILARIKMRIQMLELKKSGFWDIKLISGKQILLPLDEANRTLDEFVRSYPKLKNIYLKLVHRFDLRYSNGFVMKFNKNLNSSLK